MTAVADLGNLRLELGTRLGLRTPGVLAYAWVHRFPLFTWDEEGKRWDATHNPFSAPVWDQADRIEADPGAIRARQYDLALNGWELGGGSVRIHPRDLLERAFALMGHSLEGMRDQFGALLDALEYGAPPHVGIAIGIDRWAALLADVENIREVTAFPEAGNVALAADQVAGERASTRLFAAAQSAIDRSGELIRSSFVS